MLKVKTIIVSILAILTLNSWSQQLPISNQSFTNKFAISPAFAGFNGNTECFMGYRQSWVGISGAPTLAILNANGPFGTNMGYGVGINAEQIGSFRNFHLNFTYAYHIIFGDAAVSIALSPNYYKNQIDFSKIKSYGTNLDPALQNRDALTGSSFDVGIGLMFGMKGFNLGVVVPNTIGMKIKYKETETIFKTQRHYLVHLSYAFDNQTFQATPSVVVRTTQTSKLNYEVSSLLGYHQKIWTVLGYRTGSGILFGIGGALSDRMVANYTYDFGSGRLSGVSGGSHELCLGFLIKRSKERKLPTIFPVGENEESVSNPINNQILEKKIAKVETELKKEITTREEEIKRLEKLIAEKKTETTNNNNQIKPPDNTTEKEYNDPFILKNIKFGNSNDRLFSSSFPELNKIVQHMKQNPDLIVKITGYLDNVGTVAYNQKLSENRAKSVADYLISEGIEAIRIKYEGKGSDNPMGDNSTPEGRAMNRRIEAAYGKKK